MYVLAAAAPTPKQAAAARHTVSAATPLLRSVLTDGRGLAHAGGSSGIGYEASRKLARAGATVVLAVRNLEAGEE
jgi:hypothetical protein